MTALALTFASITAILFWFNRRQLFPGLYEKPMVKTVLKLAREDRATKMKSKSIQKSYNGWFNRYGNDIK